MLLQRTSAASLGSRIVTRNNAKPAYLVRLASSTADVRAAQTLRFLVFNLELNEGLEHSFLTFRDADRFDEVCDHLVVEHAATGEIVGTYRLQTGRSAAENLGYYSAQEFDLSCFDPLRDQVVELGRACVHSFHRNPIVLGLLWRGIASYAKRRGGRYLIGCSSVNSQDPAAGTALFDQLAKRHLAPPHLRTQPLPACACPQTDTAQEIPKVPKLLMAYLSLGAVICGPPAIDRTFKTIDFLTALDLEQLKGLRWLE